jgi:hypothetical protein
LEERDREEFVRLKKVKAVIEKKGLKWQPHQYQQKQQE